MNEFVDKSAVILRPKAVPQGLHHCDCPLGSTRGAEESKCRRFFAQRSSPLGSLRMTVVCACFLTVLVIGCNSAHAEEIPIRIDGKVIRVDEAKRILVLGFEHPATGVHEEREFFVSEDAGFKDFKKLSELNEGDLVSLDYLDYKPTPKAVYVMHIPLKKVYFTRKQIAEALVKMKAGPKENDGKKN